MPNGDGGRIMGAPPGQPNVKVNINLTALETSVCPECGCPFFYTNLAIYKKLTSVESPTGKAETVRVILSQCMECGIIVQPKGMELERVLIEKVEPEGEKKDA